MLLIPISVILISSLKIDAKSVCLPSSSNDNIGQFLRLFDTHQKKTGKMCKKPPFCTLCGSEKRFSCKLYSKLLLIQMVDRNMQLSQQLLNVRTGGRHISRQLLYLRCYHRKSLALISGSCCLNRSI